MVTADGRFLLRFAVRWKSFVQDILRLESGDAARGNAPIGGVLPPLTEAAARPGLPPGRFV